MMNRLLVLAMITLGSLAWSQTGTIRGVVSSDAGPAQGCYVFVVPADGGEYRGTTQTDTKGSFVISKVPVGSYNVEFSGTGLEPYTEEGVEVTSGGSINLEVFMIAPVNIMEAITVSSASRRAERIVEAPAAVTVIMGKDIENQTSHGQLPRLLENQPGVEITQSGVYDFNINARGFNSSLNRRILTLIDGRDPAVAFLGNQEWSALSVPLEEFASMELVRGPGSALYGANAFNGVLNIRTKSPADNPGGYATLSLGELDYYRADVRYAHAFNNGWSFRVNGGTFSSDSWSKSRTAADLPFEYGSLPNANSPISTPEAVPLDLDPVEAILFGARVDKQFFNGHTFTFEVGSSKTERGDAVTGLGRVQIDESERPWFRFNYNMPNWNFMYWRSDRETPIGQTSLTSGAKLWEDSFNDHVEIQFNRDLFDNRVSVVAGGAYHRQDIDTRDDGRNPDGTPRIGPNGESSYRVHTLMGEAKDEDQQALFGQITWRAHEKLDIVLAGRWDDSSLHDSQESPKAAVVYKINENHTVRGTFNQAFQTPNFSEFYLRAPSSIIPFGDIAGAFGEEAAEIIGWQNAPVMALGNEDLTVEQIETYEIGYKGIIGNAFVTVDYYESNITNFVTDLLPGVNPNLTPYILADRLPPGYAEAILGIFNSNPTLRALLPGLSVNEDPGNPFIPEGHPMFTVSYTNAGEVDVDGLDFTLNYYVNDNWVIDANYSLFNFDVVDAGVEGDIVPNAPESKWNVGLAYNTDNMNLSFKYKDTDGFPWAAGIFVGEVPGFQTVNLNGTYNFGEALRLSLNVINALDDEHYELYGGSVNGRQANASVTYSW